MEIRIALFGTCGGSTWRDRFKTAYDKLNIAYYDPQIVGRSRTEAERIAEARHLRMDGIVLFSVLAETYGDESLSETGFSIASAIAALETHRFVVIYIEPEPDPSLQAENPERYDASLRQRQIVLQHLQGLRLRNVYIVGSLDEMLIVSLELHDIARRLQLLGKRFNPRGIDQ